MSKKVEFRKSRKKTLLHSDLLSKRDALYSKRQKEEKA